MMVTIKQISSKEELDKAFSIRRQVFCIEQNVSEEIEPIIRDRFKASGMEKAVKEVVSE